MEVIRYTDKLPKFDGMTRPADWLEEATSIYEVVRAKAETLGDETWEIELMMGE